ncbi:hypothetical protein C8F01DRAFT_1374203 [Mycena amicta]|nr:hypothetical protein C8F01DRAFT_1374203 [Mycena amicta]
MSNDISAHALRNVGKTSQPPTKMNRSTKTKKVSGAEMATKQLKLDTTRATQAALKAQYATFSQRREDTIAAIHADFPATTEQTIRRYITSTVMAKKTRAATVYNAYVSKVCEDTGKNMKDAKAQVGEEMRDAGVKTARELVGEEEAEELLERLKEKNATKTHGIRYINAANVADCHSTANKKQVIADDLFTRTGARSFGMQSRGHADDQAQPYLYFSPDADHFAVEVLKMSTVELMRRFDSWSTTQDQAPRTYETVESLRHTIIELILDGLRKITKKPNATMHYKAYDLAIRYKLGVQIVGDVNGDMPRDPSKITTLDQLRQVRGVWKSGETRWVFLNKTEEKVLEKEMSKQRTKGPLGKRAPRKDRGKSRPKRKAQPCSDSDELEEDKSEEDKSEEDTSEEDKSEEDEESPKSRKAPATKKTYKSRAVIESDRDSEEEEEEQEEEEQEKESEKESEKGSEKDSDDNNDDDGWMDIDEQMDIDLPTGTLAIKTSTTQLPVFAGPSTSTLLQDRGAANVPTQREMMTVFSTQPAKETAKEKGSKRKANENEWDEPPRKKKVKQTPLAAPLQFCLGLHGRPRRRRRRRCSVL